MDDVISTNQFKNGNHIEVEGTIFKILEFQHVKPGKGGAFVRTKLRRASDGAVIDRTFRAGEKFRPIHTEARKMQFLYSDGTDAHFMDEESYDQIALPEPSVAETLKWVRPNESVDLLYIDGSPSMNSRSTSSLGLIHFSASWTCGSGIASCSKDSESMKCASVPSA